MSSFKPINALKDLFISGYNSFKIRNILVVFQFFITILVIIFTLVIYLQTKYLKNKNLGFNKENIVVIHRAYSLGTHKESFKRILMNNPKVICVSNTNSLPGGHFNDNSYRHEYELSTIKHTIPKFFIPVLLFHNDTYCNDTIINKWARDFREQSTRCHAGTPCRRQS